MKYYSVNILLVTIFVFSGNAFGSLVFYAPMDGSYEGKGTGLGEITVTTENGNPTFVEGKRGQAILTGSELGHLVYTITGKLPATMGTIEFWVYLEDWDGMSDEQFHEWFVSHGDDGWVQLYKYYQQSRFMFFLTGEPGGKYTLVGKMIHKWKSGQWHHLVGTWSPMESALYVDGKLEGKISELRYPKELPQKFNFGDHTPKGHSRMDEFYLYNRPLTMKEAKWTYDNAATRVAGEDVPASVVKGEKESIRVNVKPSPARRNALVQLLVLGPDFSKGSQGNIKIAAEAGEIEIPFTIGEDRFIEKMVDLGNLQKGEYSVGVSLKIREGEQAYGTSTLYWAGNPVWRGSGVGMKPVVSKGYEPMKVTGRHVKCIGRNYQFGDFGLPRQINSAGYDLLTEPIVLEMVTSEGQEIFESIVPTKIKAISEGQVEIQANFVGTQTDISIKAEAYFDGLFKYEISIKPKSKKDTVTIEKLVLHMPFVDGIAELYHYTGISPTTGKLKDEQGTILSGGFGPFIWAGNNDCGLMFMCESDEFFSNADNKNVYRYVRDANSMDMAVVFIDKPHKLAKDEEWRVAFGLQASPVRPLAKGWRKNRIVSGENWKISTLWPNPKVMKYYGYPEAPSDPNEMMEMIRSASGKLLLPYINPSMLSGGSPEWRQFGSDWKVPGLSDAYCPDVTIYGDPIFGVSSSSIDWQDFLTWKTKKFLEDYAFGGLYYDHTLPIKCDNELLGEGYTRDGMRYPTFNIFSKRELYRRLYNMVKALGRETFIFAHTSDQVPLPYLAFCDGYVTGEVLYRRLKDNYLELESIDYYRTQFVGYQWGCNPYWLDEFAGEYSDSEKAFRHWTGLCLLFDCGLWPVVGNPVESNTIINTIIPYGWEDADFIPYWKNQKLITGQTDSVKVSAYRCEQGVLLCVLNLTRNPQQVKLGVNTKQLNLPSIFSARNIRTEKELETRSGILNIELEEMGLALIFLK